METTTNIEDFKHELKLNSILKMLMKEDPNRNCLIETFDGEEFADKIQIGGMTKFDSIPNPMHRQTIEERATSKCNPKNIKRISFVIDGETVEFVQCSND